jgi:hypothetical protein
VLARKPGIILYYVDTIQIPVDIFQKDEGKLQYLINIMISNFKSGTNVLHNPIRPDAVVVQGSSFN